MSEILERLYNLHFFHLNSLKDFPELVSGNVLKYLKKNPEVLEDNIKLFEKEIKFLGSEDPSNNEMDWFIGGVRLDFENMCVCQLRGG